MYCQDLHHGILEPPLTCTSSTYLFYLILNDVLKKLYTLPIIAYELKMCAAWDIKTLIFKYISLGKFIYLASK